jgi:L-cysteate sulfo-lyase
MSNFTQLVLRLAERGWISSPPTASGLTGRSSEMHHEGVSAGHEEGARPPRVTLGTWPTPVEPAPRLAERLGLDPGNLWIKRDDLMGLGAGGNKVRKLEYLCAAALEHDATTLVTSGGPQSNHARLTAAAACRLELDCVVVLAGERPPSFDGNLALQGLMGTRVVWAGNLDDAGLERRVDEVADELARRDARVAVIPLGGSNALGAQGYVDCANEIATQIPDVRHVVVAVGSGGTMAGLVAGLGPERVLGFDVGATANAEERVRALLVDLSAAGTATPEHATGSLRLRSDQVGAGYGILTPQARVALIDAAQCEGIFLDPVYTAKALSGLAAAVKDGGIKPGDRTVFVHTGGLPGLFGHDLMLDRQCTPSEFEPRRAPSL